MLREEQSLKAAIFHCSPEVYRMDKTVAREDLDTYRRNGHVYPRVNRPARSGDSRPGHPV